MINRYLLLALMQLFSFCAIVCSAKDAEAPQDVHMHVFVHGTILPTPSIDALKAAFVDDQQDTFQAYLDSLRTESFFSEQIIGPKGLHEVSLNRKNAKGNLATLAILRAYDLVSFPHNQKRTHINRYYTFGWSGQLDATHRQKAAEIFFLDLEREKARLKQNASTKTIHLTIIAHSHGGNVAARLSTIKKGSRPLYINRLVLIGTPIGDETRKILTDPDIGDTYNLYSRGDIIQSLDVFSIKNLSPKRRLIPLDDPISTDITLQQIELQVNHYKPRHSELWMMSSVPALLYRPGFPLLPYPVVAFLPIILRTLETQKITDPNLIVKINKKPQELVFEFVRKNKQKEKLHTTHAGGAGIQDLFIKPLEPASDTIKIPTEPSWFKALKLF